MMESGDVPVAVRFWTGQSSQFVAENLKYDWTLWNSRIFEYSEPELCSLSIRRTRIKDLGDEYSICYSLLQNERRHR